MTAPRNAVVPWLALALTLAAAIGGVASQIFASSSDVHVLQSRVDAQEKRLDRIEVGVGTANDKLDQVLMQQRQKTDR